VFKFIEDKPENFQLIKLMAEDEDINDIIENNMTSKNFHKIFLLSNN
jgi:mevalonate pyrophosphate decarboxylase